MPSDDSFDLLEAQRRIFTSDLRPLERLVALALLDHWSVKSPRPFASVTRLQRWTGLCRHAVVAALRGLRARGAIMVSDSRRGSKSTYDLTPLMRLPVHETHQSDHQSGARDAPVQEGEVVHETHRTGARDAPEVVHETHSKEPIEGTHLRNPRSRARARKGSAAVQTSLLSEPERPKAESSDHVTVRERYFASFREERGEEPVFGGAEGKAIKTLLEKAGSADKACAFIERAFRSFRRKSVTILQISKDPSAFSEDTKPGRYQPQATTPELQNLGREAGAALVRRGPGPVQRGHGVDPYANADIVRAGGAE